MIARRLTVRGRVQGVGYRDATIGAARVIAVDIADGVVEASLADFAMRSSA